MGERHAGGRGVARPGGGAAQVRQRPRQAGSALLPPSAREYGAALRRTPPLPKTTALKNRRTQKNSSGSSLVRCQYRAIFGFICNILSKVILAVSVRVKIQKFVF